MVLPEIEDNIKTSFSLLLLLVAVRLLKQISVSTTSIFFFNYYYSVLTIKASLLPSNALLVAHAGNRALVRDCPFVSDPSSYKAVMNVTL